MKSLRKSVSLVFALLLTATAGRMEAQDAAQTPQKPSDAPAQKSAPTPQSDTIARIRVNPTLVVVPVTVKDGSGGLVPDLTKEEFRLLEDDVEQNISLFSVDPFPLSIVILIDDDLQKRVAEQVEPTLPAIVGGMSTLDEAYVCRFDENLHPGKGFTSDQDKLLTELKRTGSVMSSLTPAPAPSPGGGTMGSGPTINGAPAPGAPTIPPSGTILKGRTTKAVDDALYEAAQLLKDRGRDRRKIILIVSDGTNGKRNTHKFDETVKELLRMNISVYALGVGNAFYDRGVTVISKYAHATAGDVFYAENRGAMGDLYARLAEQARNQYTLAYTPRGSDKAKEFHTIEVRVKRQGLKVVARDGYYSGAAPH